MSADIFEAEELIGAPAGLTDQGGDLVAGLGEMVGDDRSDEAAGAGECDSHGQSVFTAEGGGGHGG